MIALLGRVALRITCLLLVMVSSAFFLQVFLPIAVPITILVVVGFFGMDLSAIHFGKRGE
jgi:hypothetical protein